MTPFAIKMNMHIFDTTRIFILAYLIFGRTASIFHLVY